MVMKNISDGIFRFSKILLVIAHPDDEVNCATLVSRYIKMGKDVKVILLTSGDAGVNPANRMDEMVESLHSIGVGSSALQTLLIPEKSLLEDASRADKAIRKAASEYLPDCVLSLDYEGGHEGHDMAAFLAHRAAKQAGAEHIVFPDYHFRDMHRHGLEFQPDRAADYTVELSDEEKDLKIKLLEAHRGQLGFYMRLQKVQSSYFNLLFSREIYRTFPREYDFSKRPDYQIGYEYHRNGFKFDDFVRAIGRIVDGE